MSEMVERECQQCDKPFQVHARYVQRGAGKFCSRTCALSSKRKQVEKRCPVCGKQFFAFYYLRDIQKTCSQPCAGQLRRTKVKRICRNCGKPFLKNPSQFNYFKGAGKYCSRPCSYAGTVKANAGKPSSDRWGRTNLKADKDWRDAVREKDQRICQRCGKFEQYIHAHHVAPRSRRPDLKYDVSNGKCLCNSCHTWVHRNPIEATALGLLSDASYEAAHLKQSCVICGKPMQGHGYCATHYSRWRKHGDPLFARKPGRPPSTVEGTVR